MPLLPSQIVKYDAESLRSHAEFMRIVKKVDKRHELDEGTDLYICDPCQKQKEVCNQKVDDTILA